MAMDAISEQRLSQVCPTLADKIRQLYDMITDEPIRVTQGMRSWLEQRRLWLQGRDENGNIVDESLIVTKAPPGHSWHEFGLAVDVAPFDSENRPDWNLSHPVWSQIITSGEALGMYSGDQFHSIKDDPHFQLTGRFPVSPDNEARRILQSAGPRAVWIAAGLVTS